MSEEDAFKHDAGAAKIGQLIIKYMRGELTAAEEKQLEDWKGASVSNSQLFDELNSDEFRLELVKHYKKPDTEFLLERLKNRLNGQVELPKSKLPKRLSVSLRWVAAMAVIAIWIIVYYGHTIWIPAKPDRPIKLGSIGPGGNHATLSLADGTILELDSKQNAIVVNQHAIAYPDGHRLQTISGHSEQLILATPRGGQYQVVLPDGTKVWLNASTVLTYPSFFEGDDRRVEVEGEAFFSVVQQQDKPFRVFSRGQEIDVLSTEFNVNSYADESELLTTLLQGKVRVKNLTSQASILLAPNEQAIVKNNTIIKQAVNASYETAWINGIFVFTNVPFEKIMRQVGRWYDIDVRYEGRIPKIDFKGEMHRGVNLTTLLTFFQESGVHFRWEDGRKLVVKNEL
ncbi:FecR family protein [bacterium A37T11]|nr:FecR family protein [bacterium A37T11]